MKRLKKISYFQNDNEIFTSFSINNKNDSLYVTFRNLTDNPISIGKRRCPNLIYRGETETQHIMYDIDIVCFTESDLLLETINPKDSLKKVFPLNKSTTNIEFTFGYLVYCNKIDRGFDSSFDLLKSKERYIIKYITTAFKL
jgi:hypothetical protein